jgi:hypothetical protein
MTSSFNPSCGEPANVNGTGVPEARLLPFFVNRAPTDTPAAITAKSIQFSDFTAILIETAKPVLGGHNRSIRL